LSSKFDAALATIRGRAKAAARKTASANDQGS
jgi:hypothetical protein